MCMHRHDQTLFVVSVQSVGSSLDGASEASGAFLISSETHFDGASESSEVLLAIEASCYGASEASGVFYICNIHIIVLS